MNGRSSADAQPEVRGIDRRRTVAAALLVAIAACAALVTGIAALAGATVAESSGHPAVSTLNDAEFVSSTYAGEQGDVLRIEIELSDTDRTTLVVGSEEANYRVEVEVVGERYSTVVVEMDTYSAGGWNGATPDEVFSGSNGADVSATRTTGDLSSPLDPGQYIVDTEVDGSTTDRAAIELSEPSIDEATANSAPGDEPIESVQDLGEVVAGRSAVQPGDQVVVEVDADGLPNGLETGSDLDPGAEGVTMTTVQSNPEPNEQPVEIDLQEATVIENQDDGVFYVVIDTDRPAIETGQEFEFVFAVDEANPFVEQRRELTAEFEVVEPETAFDSDSPTYPHERGVTVSGTSTLAPGEELTIEAEGAPALFERETTTVDDDGTFSVPIDFTDSEPGETAELRLLYDDDVVDEADAEIVDPDAAEPDVAFVDAELPTQLDSSDEVTVSATLENEGDAVADVPVAFVVGGTAIEESDVTLEPGERTTLEYRWDLDLEPGEYEYGFVTDDDSALTVLEVTDDDEPADDESPSLAIGEVSIPAEVERDEPIRSTITVTNGGGEGEATIFVVFDGEAVEEEQVTLGAGENRELSFEHDHDATPGEYEYEIVVQGSGTDEYVAESIEILDDEGVDGDGGTDGGDGTDGDGDGETDDGSSDDDGVDGDGDDTEDDVDDDSTADQAELVVDAASIPTRVDADEPLEANVTVANEGSAAGNATLELTIENETVEREIDLEAGANETVSIAESFDLEPGRYQYELSLEGATANESETGSIRVSEAGAGNSSADREITFGDEDGQPGFTAAVAIAALVAVALARRR